MEELDLRKLLLKFWNKKIQIIIIVLVSIIVGTIYSFLIVKPMYNASTTLVLATTNANTNNSSANDNNINNNSSSGESITETDVALNSKLVATYSELVKSKNVLRQVISNLGIQVDEEELKQNITVESVKDTALIKILVKTNESYNSKIIANEMARVFSEKVKEIYKIENIHIVDTAEETDEPYNINHGKDILIFFLIGLVIVILYVLMSNMLDNTKKLSEEAEKENNLPMFAVIPLDDKVVISKENKTENE